MDTERTHKKNVNPKQKANIFSKLTFWYVIELFKKGYKRELEEEDLYEIPPEFDTTKLGDKIESQWNLHKCSEKTRLFIVFWNLVGKTYSLLGLTQIIIITTKVLRPIFLGKFVFYFTFGQTEVSKREACFCSCFLVLFQFVEVVCRQNNYFIGESLAIKVRTAIAALIYRKLLKLPIRRLRHISFGMVINVITRDVNVWDEFFVVWNETVAGIIIIVLNCCYMYQIIGLPALVVVVSLILVVPFQACIGLWMYSLRTATSEKTEKRIENLEEVLSNIRTIKMYVWQKHVESKILSIRRNEMNTLMKMFMALFISISAVITVYNVAFYLVIMTHIWLNQKLTAQIMYFITGTFINISYYLVVAIPYTTFNFSQTISAIKRMQTLVQKLEAHNLEIFQQIATTNIPKIKIENATFGTGNQTVLTNVNFEVVPGLTVVTGNAGSGKTFLLLTVLKECEVVDGNVRSEGTISYASQQPWLFPATIRQNIIFGARFDQKRYQEVIKACALKYDFQFLEKGDSTVIADGGTNLSKGQQIRVNLARAVYQDREIYLLDDALCSLDVIVARQIFANCILKLLRDKLVILISNDLNLLPYARTGLKLEGQRVVPIHIGEPKSIYECEESTTNVSLQVMANGNDYGTTDLKSKLLLTNTNKIYEHKKIGAVSLQTYKSFLKFGSGGFFLPVIFCAFLLSQFVISYKDKLISKWVNLEDQISQTNTSDIEKFNLIESRSSFIYQYSIAVIMICLTALLRAWLLFHFTKKVAISLHRKMLSSVLHASSRFFDVTFIGNIVNRFSKDLVTIDESLPFPVYHFVTIVFETSGSLVLIFSTNIRLLIPTVLLISSIIFLMYFCLKAGRALKRLDSTTKSPVVGYFKATLEGLLSIKVSQAELNLKTEFENRHNLYNSASFSYLCCLKAFSFYADLFAMIFAAVIVLQFLIFDEGVSTGDVGLAVTQAFFVAEIFYYAVSNVMKFQTFMTSIERTIEFTDIPHELLTGLVLENWPEQPEINYERVFLTVNDSNSYILKNVNFVIKPGEKIGVVGRTGAGKSSIISALFRLYEPKGKITIDGVDIKTLSLNFLRSKISIIPQDPILINGTIRYNIDPDWQCTEEDIWKALKTVQLSKIVCNLSIDVQDLNLTCGQKQLVSLARVLVKNNKILVLDEMVENVDSEIEELISEIIDNHFASYTVIKIAHKLKFVRKCDKILVVDNGEVVEFDSPQNLLQDQKSLFYKMFKWSDFKV